MENDYIASGRDVVWRVSESECSLTLTLDCGQSFRFIQAADGVFEGVVHGRILRMRQSEEGIRFFDMTLSEFEKQYVAYFDMTTDYTTLKAQFCSDSTLKKAIACTEGIRVLRQDGFETLISFLITQNNNIPRIKKSIRLLCERFGKRLAPDAYTFPTAETLAGCRPDDLAGLSLGYRDRYLIDAAQHVLSGDISLAALSAAPVGQAREMLRRILGVGPKVAECVLLFGFGRHECFPMDTWMKKVMQRYYPDGLPAPFLSKAGIAQQYLFHYARCFDSF